MATAIAVHLWCASSRVTPDRIVVVPISVPPERRCDHDDDASGEVPTASPYAIECRAENDCVVDRQLVNRLLTDPSSLTRLARFVPSQRDGRVRGLKLYGIRGGSLLDGLGFDNGDMLTHVDGQEVTALDRALSLVARLQHAPSVTVTLVRHDATLTKQIRVR